jgi:hypothetical protein
MGPRSDGTRMGLDKIDPGLSEASGKSLTRLRREGTRCAVKGARSNVQPPRTRFARARVPRAFTRFFEMSCCRFAISIRRPEAHFARREAQG